MATSKHLVITALASTLAGCSGGCPALSDLIGDSDESQAGAGKRATGAGGVDQSCGGKDFPCTWDDVSDDAFARMDAVATEGLGVALQTRSSKAVAKALAGHDDVTVLGTSAGAVRFRVAGGRPAWIFTGGANTRGGGLPMAPLSWASAAASGDGSDSPPAGLQRHGERPKKKALVLSPFAWQWSLTGSSDYTAEIENTLRGMPDYSHGVTFLANEASNQQIETHVGLADFMEWDRYDAIHVSTHGGVACDRPPRPDSKQDSKQDTKAPPAEQKADEPDDAAERNCVTVLATGELWNASDSGAIEAIRRAGARQLGLEMGYLPLAGSAATGARELGLETISTTVVTKEGKTLTGDTPWKVGPFLLANAKLFAAKYEGGLDDKIIFLDACEGGRQSDLSGALVGNHTAVLGWTESVDVTPSSLASSCFWKALAGKKQEGKRDDRDKCDVAAQTEVTGGRTVEAAFNKLAANWSLPSTISTPRAIIIEGTDASSDGSGARLEEEGDNKTRPMEIIRLVDDYGDLLGDRGGVTLVGAPGDGEPDSLEITAEIRGLQRGEEPSQFAIQLSVDDRPTRTTWRATEEVEEGVYRGTETIDLGFDLPAGRRFNLDPWVTYPNGLSRWHYDDVAATYFVFTISGPAFSTPQTFFVSAEDMNPHWFTEGGFKLGYSANSGAPAVSEDGSVLKNWLGNQGYPEVPEPGEHPFGEGADGRYSFTVIIIPQNKPCPAGAQRCPRRALRTELGTIDITEYALGRSISRPHESGSNIVAGAFELPARAGKPWEDERYQIKGAMFLIE